MVKMERPRKINGLEERGRSMVWKNGCIYHQSNNNGCILYKYDQYENNQYIPIEKYVAVYKCTQ
jgi:hypothetical protein